MRPRRVPAPLLPLLLALLAWAPAPAPRPGDDPPADAAAVEAQATPGEDLDFAGAVRAYRERRYVEAGLAFGRLAQAEPDAGRRAVLHANAGTALARAKRLGEAAWQLRLALSEDPRDPVAAANLARVSELLGHGGEDRLRFTNALRELPLLLSRGENALLGAALAGLALALVAVRRLGRAPRAIVPPAAALLVLGLGWSALARAAWAEHDARAVVLRDATPGHAEPDEASEILFRLPEGEVVRRDEERRGWRLVETPAGARGWVAAPGVAPLSDPGGARD